MWTAGAGAPALLLHGFGDDGSCWVSTAPLFSDRGRQVIAPDARAHGGTPLRFGDDFTAASRLSDVERLAGSLGLADVLVVGHSMGAVTAMHLAADHPDLIRTAILVDPPLTGRDLDAERKQQNPFEDWVAEIVAMEPAELGVLCATENPNWTEEEVAAWVSSKRALDRNLFTRIQSWHGRSWRAAIESIRCPKTVIAGEPALGSAVDAEAGRWLHDNPDVEFVRVSCAGHSVHRDQRSRFAHVVNGFLTRSGV